MLAGARQTVDDVGSDDHVPETVRPFRVLCHANSFAALYTARTQLCFQYLEL